MVTSMSTMSSLSCIASLMYSSLYTGPLYFTSYHNPPRPRRAKRNKQTNKRKNY